MSSPELYEDTISFPVGPMGSRLEARFFRTTVAPTESATGFAPRVLNQLPIRVVDDYPVGGELKRRGGVIVPLVAGDACRIDLRVLGGVVAARIGAGKINALSGEAWNDRVPPQPGEHLCVGKRVCIDGFLASGGNAQQFVAHPMGFGSTAEERETGSAIWGGAPDSSHSDDGGSALAPPTGHRWRGDA